MSTNEQNLTPENPTEEPQEVEQNTAVPRRPASAFLRAVLYAPIFLMLASLAAVAMYPALAEYANPILGISTESHCQKKMKLMQNGGSACCSSNATASAMTASSCCSANAVAASCCSEKPATDLVLGDESVFFAEEKTLSLKDEKQNDSTEESVAAESQTISTPLGDNTAANLLGD